MENVGVPKKQTGETASAGRAVWDPFWLMREMFGWGRSGDAPSFEVKETDDAYVCKVKVKLELPDRADVAHAKAQLDRGELTLVVPKAAAPTPEPVTPPRKAPRATGSGNGSARRTPRGGTRTGRRG